MAHHSEATLYDVSGKRKIARVGLNGYKSFTQHPTRTEDRARLIWSFTILDGDRDRLENAWAHRQLVMLTTDSGRSVPVTLAAFPADEHSFGLIEFV